MAKHGPLPDLSNLDLAAVKRLLAQRDVGYLDFRMGSAHVVLRQIPPEDRGTPLPPAAEAVTENPTQISAHEQIEMEQPFVRAPATGIIEWQPRQGPGAGDVVRAGDVLGLVQSGSRRVEVKVDVSGTVRLVRNTGKRGLVQYGDWLVAIERN